MPPPALRRDGRDRYPGVSFLWRTSEDFLTWRLTPGTGTHGRAMRQVFPSPTEITFRQTNDWFRTLAETTSTAIFVFHADRLLYVNPACEALTGYSAEELL